MMTTDNKLAQLYADMFGPNHGRNRDNEIPIEQRRSLDGPVEYLTASEVEAKYGDILTPYQKEVLRKHRESLAILGDEQKEVKPNNE